MYYNYQPYGEMVLPTSFTKITWWSKLISQWATRECFILHCIVQPQTIFCKPKRIRVPQHFQDHLLGIFLCLQSAKTFHQIRITSLYNFLCTFMINNELCHFIHTDMNINEYLITIQLFVIRIYPTMKNILLISLWLYETIDRKSIKYLA